MSLFIFECSMSISDKIREAREWSRCIDTLKASVDSMYEICRIQQNILGCEEAIMFLKNGIRDFLSLVDTIKIEQNWENSEKRPMTALAWEIRGTVARGSNGPAPAKELKEKQCQTPSKRVEKPKEKKENEWQLVERKKGSANRHINKQHEVDYQLVPFGGKARKAPPKSAMDLPQTKASMAKMAYSRQLLFEKHKKTLLEKFNNRRRAERQSQQNEKAKGTKGTSGEEERRPMVVLAEEERKSLERDEQMAEGCLKTLIDQLSDDCEWRAMTEEEESLAQEEQSLKKEIEEEEEEDDELVDEEFTLKMRKKDKADEEKHAREEEEIAMESDKTHYRNPGELAQLRAKLLSPTKRRRTEEIDHFSESKLRRAEELRSMLQQEKAFRLHLLHQRVEEVSKKREEIQQKKMAHLEMVKERIQKAEENRQKSLEEIVQRAQEDEMKDLIGPEKTSLPEPKGKTKKWTTKMLKSDQIMEFNLLNSFEQANQRLEKRFTQIRERNRYDKMVQRVEEERQRRIEENKQQREEAEKRRKDVEEQRAQRLKDQASQHQERQSTALKHRTKTMEKYRAKIAQHSQKVCQRKARELADKQQLLDKIQRKHEKRTENYEQCKEQVRRRAIGPSSPRPCHYWAQCMADFGQIPSDLSLQQKPSVLSDSFDLTDKTSTVSVNCFRCGTKLVSDLHLMAHILSREHLAKVESDLDILNSSSVLSYDFLRNELEKMAAPEDGVAEEVMSKSTEECTIGGGIVPMERIIAKNAKLLLIANQNLVEMLTVEGIIAAAGKSGMKKKRIKVRQRIVREFDQLALNKGERKPNERNKVVDALLWRIGKCEKNVEVEEMGQVERGLAELIKVVQCAINSKHERTVLQRAIHQSDLLEKLLALNILIEQKSEKKEKAQSGGSWIGRRILTKCIVLLNDLIAFNTNYNARPCLPIGGKAILHMCDLFQLLTKAFSGDEEKLFGSLTECANHPLFVAIAILRQFGHINLASDRLRVSLLFSYLCQFCSLIEFIPLCARRLDLADFLSSIKIESDPNQSKQISPCEGITYFITIVLDRIGNKESDQQEEIRQKQPMEEVGERQSLARNNSVESQDTSGTGTTINCSSTSAADARHPAAADKSVRICSVLWMYCLSLQGFQHFRLLSGCSPNPNANSTPDSSCSAPLPSSSPPSPSKSDQTHHGPMTETLSKCILAQFNSMATINCPVTGEEPMLKSIMNIENDRTMAIRLICILRAILHLTTKSFIGNNNEGTKRGQTDQNDQQMASLSNQCIRAIGHFAVSDARNQFLCVLGWQHSVLSMLCSVPLEFVHSAPSKHILLPTLIAILRHCPIGVDQIRGKFCLHYLIDYLKAAIQSKSSKQSESVKFDFLSLLEPSVDQWILAREFLESASNDSAFLPDQYSDH